jgi:uncharacterized protein (DUF362 family)
VGSYENIGLTLDESLTGWIGIGETDPVEGRVQGEKQNTRLTMRSRLTVDSLRLFLDQSAHAARLEGTLDFSTVGQAMPMDDGVFNVFVVDPRTGARQMVYEARFAGPDGKHYFLRGVKHLTDDPGLDVVEDMTTLFTTIYEGDDDQGTVFGAGQLFFRLSTTPAFLWSLTVTGDAHFGQVFAAKMAFLSFAFGQTRDTYLADINPVYDACYQNVVLQGEVTEAGEREPFFLVSGIHTPDFPWGDGETFCDVLLVLGDPDDAPRRYAISARRLTQTVDVLGGSLSYDGPIFDLTSRPVVSFSEMEAGTSLVAGRAKIDLHFRAKVHPLAPFPFRINSSALDRMSYRVREMLRRVLPSAKQFGFEIVPHSLSAVSGTIEIASGTARCWTVDTSKTHGEAEDSTIRNVREPTLLYGYICALRPGGTARVQFHTSTLRNEREYWGKDRLDAFFGSVVSRFASKDLDIRPDGMTVTDLAEAEKPALFQHLGAPVLDVRNDHFPTAVFQRRVIRVEDPSGDKCLALEEAMDTLRREPIDSSQTVKVAAIRDTDAHVALRRALQESGFWQTIEQVRVATGKAKDQFSVVIKANFMFAYNKHDVSTFTDPALVEDLVRQLRDEGYRRIAVVEAHSTYGQYFANRRVREVASYLGYAVDGSRGYDVVDLTEDQQDHRHFGPALGYHPVPVTWRDADFRVSFAKNKTHCYAYYTLTIKNVYGALSLGDKFKEYHCDRGIYAPTIEYLNAYPVHFGIIDAWLSADGPFGIFADAEPNPTHTILASPSLVAVDWVGASKMGMDPKISPYMKLAVKAFGKPAIELVGDASNYHPWLNVPLVLSMATNFGLDANHTFGNLFYMSTAYMDSNQFPLKSRSALLHAVRGALKPIQEAVFLTPEGNRTRANRALGKLLTWLGQ